MKEVFKTRLERHQFYHNLVEENKEHPLFFAIMGNLISDGHLDIEDMNYSNIEIPLLNRFIENFKKVFSIDLKIRFYHNQCSRVYCYRRVLCRYLFRYIELQNLNFTNDEQKISFLTSCFNDEGSVSKEGTISISQKDKNYILLIKQLLADLWIIKTVVYPIFNKKYNEMYWGLRISKKHNSFFMKKIPFLAEKQTSRLLKHANRIESFERLKIFKGRINSKVKNSNG